MGTSEPLEVSVIIPVYDRVGPLHRALQSVLAQSRLPGEILVVDDGSNVDLEMESLANDPRLRLLRHPTNLGAAAARNTGIREANRAFIAFLDSDDVWHPRKLERQMSFMDDAGLDASCTAFSLAHEEGKSVRLATRPYSERLGLEDLTWGCYVSPGTTLVATRERLLEVGGYDIACSRLEDWDLLLRMAQKGFAIGYLEQPLADVYPGGAPSREVVFASLEHLGAKHVCLLRARDARLSQAFESAMEFEAAAACRTAGDLLGTIWHLTRSLAKCPKGNQAFRIALRSRLRRLL